MLHQQAEPSNPYLSVTQLGGVTQQMICSEK